jgi:Tfp pilus assembly protein PilF
MLGFIFQGRQEYTRAIVEYRRALELRPGWFEVRNNLGSIYLATSDWQQAIDIFGPLTDEPTYRTPGNAHNNLGWALYKMRRYDEAAEHFRSAVQFQPELCQGYNNQGLTYEALGQLADARKAYESCVARPGCKRYAEPRYRLANLMLSAGDVEGALTQFQSCAEAEVGTQFADSCREYLKAAGR